MGEERNVAERAQEILENPEAFFKGGKVAGGGTAVTVSAMVVLASQPLPEGEAKKKHLRAFRIARNPLLATLSKDDDIFKGPHQVEPKEDEEWPANIQAIASASYVVQMQEAAVLMGRLGMAVA